MNFGGVDAILDVVLGPARRRAACLEEALRSDPDDDAEQLLEQGRLLLRLGRTQEGLHRLGRAALMAGPSQTRAAALALRGLVQARQGRKRTALRSFDLALKEAPEASWLLGLRRCVHGNGEDEASQALRLAGSGRLAQAGRFCRASLSRNPFASVLLAWVEVFLRGGNCGRAFAVLSRQRPRLPPPAGPDELAAHYRLAVLDADVPGAERYGEALLGLSREFRHVETLTRPFFIGEFDFTCLPPAFLRRLFDAFDRGARERPRSPWPRFLRFALRHLSGATDGVAAPKADLEVLSRFPSKRYGWMRGLTGQHRLINQRDYAGAEKDFRAAAACSQPPDWTALCFLGETLLCRGRSREALKAFSAACRAAPAGSKADALAWEGEMRLWLGQPKRALDLLDEAVKQGAIYAEGWKGGALVLLGRYEEALSCLERAIERTPHDGESRTWRAEALLRSGQAREALAAADLALERYRRYTGFYLLAVRGLAQWALGQAEAPRQAARYIPRKTRDFVRARVPGSRGKTPRAFARLLEGALRLSRGVRRDRHELAIWMR